MAINLDIIGKKKKYPPFKYEHKDVILYALGIGAKLDELDFLYEQNLKVFPTFSVIPFGPAIFPFIEEAGINLFALLHGEQKIILHAPIPASGEIINTAVCSSIWDKGDNGAVFTLDAQGHDAKGTLLFETRTLLMDRSGGNFGGERGPKTLKIAPPEGQTPDFRVAYKTSPQQAALYRLTGDMNPLHIDPEFARLGGLEAPILHGLCTYGYAGRAILHSICNGDPTLLKSFSVRFMGVAFPGETLITEGWKQDEKNYIITTKTQDGRLVLGNGTVEIA